MKFADASPPVLFRADSYDSVGLGHVKRCAALAQALRKLGSGSVFAVYTQDAAIDGTLGPLGMPVVRLGSRVNTDNDISATVALTKQYGTRTVVVDSYAVDEAYFQTYHDAGQLVAYFEDYGRVDWPVDAVINGLIGAETLGYQSPHKLLGADYMALGPEYWAPEPDNSRDGGPFEIMITMGGIDHFDLTSRILAILDKMDQELKVHVVAGPYFQNEDNIEVVIERCRHPILIHKQLDSLAPIISRCQMAVSAGGITLYELAAFGVPTVGIWLWENQRQNVERLGKAGVIRSLGYE